MVVAAFIVTGLFSVALALNVDTAATVNVSELSDPIVLLPSTCKLPDNVRLTPLRSPVNIGDTSVLLVSVCSDDVVTRVSVSTPASGKTKVLVVDVGI